MVSTISLLTFILCFCTVLGSIDTKAYQKIGLVTGVSSPIPEMKLFVVRNRMAYDKCQGFTFLPLYICNSILRLPYETELSCLQYMFNSDFFWN